MTFTSDGLGPAGPDKHEEVLPGRLNGLRTVNGGKIGKLVLWQNFLPKEHGLTKGMYIRICSDLTLCSALETWQCERSSYMGAHEQTPSRFYLSELSSLKLSSIMALCNIFCPRPCVS